MRTFNRKTAFVAAATAAAVVTGGVAYAYWTNTGAGAGTAATGSNESITVNQTSAISDLAPGLPAQTLSGNFTNGNGGPVFVHAVTVQVTGTDHGGCDASDYTIGGSAVVDDEVASGPAVGSWSGLTIRFNDKADANQDACKGATVNLAYSSN
jgi:hypothetical protein